MFLQITNAMDNELLSTITASSMAVAIIQWLKNTKLVPFMNQNSAGLNRFVGWFAAFVSGAGLHYHYEASTGTLTLTGLTAAAIVHTGWDTVQSYAAQWLIYRGIVKQPAADVAAVAQGMPATITVSPGVAKAGLEASITTEGKKE